MKAGAFVFTLAMLWAAVAQAHKPSDSYLVLRQTLADVEGQWDIALRDLDYAIGLDADNDGAITWGELRGRHEAIAAYALAHLQLQADGAACTTQPTGDLVDRHTDGAYAVLRFAVHCPHVPQAIDLRYSLFFDLDPQHRGLLSVEREGAGQTSILSPSHPSEHLEAATRRPLQTCVEFWRDGVWHIWLGFDHILFLLTLLMPAVLRWHAHGWGAVPSFRPAWSETLKIVTAFTLAHSTTLTLAALGVVDVSTRVVESGIALSVVIAALNNMFPLFDGGRWLVAFGFGLLHGFGFASVLAAPGLPRGQLVLALLGFNLGVETGQLAIVGVFLPLAFAARTSWFYQRLTLRMGSALIAMVACVWMIERALGLRLL